MDVKNLLWTGGWDSTFRLLDLVIYKGKNVQPYYLSFIERRSVSLEIEAMENIKQRLAYISQSAAERVLPTVIIKQESLLPDPQLEKAIVTLREQSHLGLQYPWLKCFVQQKSLTGLELAIHRDDRAYEFVRPYVFRVRSCDDEWYEIGASAPMEIRCLFEGYRFPMLELTKLEMQDIAYEKKFAEYLELTWFCHEPTRGKRPCGICHGCRYAVAEGMGYRVPWDRRFLCHVNNGLNAIARPIPKRVRKKFLRLIRERF